MRRRRAGKDDEVVVDEVVEVGGHHGRVQRGSVAPSLGVQTDDDGRRPDASRQLGHEPSSSPSLVRRRRLPRVSRVVQHVLTVPSAHHLSATHRPIIHTAWSLPATVV